MPYLEWPSVEWIESPTPSDLRPIAGMLNRWYAEVIPGERPAPVEELEAAVNRAPPTRSRTWPSWRTVAVLRAPRW